MSDYKFRRDEYFKHRWVVGIDGGLRDAALSDLLSAEYNAPDEDASEPARTIDTARAIFEREGLPMENQGWVQFAETIAKLSAGEDHHFSSDQVRKYLE